ncbi:MAG: hypothetical protein ACXU9L_05025 [Thermodesulfobacteriota bacterium]
MTTTLQRETTVLPQSIHSTDSLVMQEVASIELKADIFEEGVLK